MRLASGPLTMMTGPDLLRGHLAFEGSPSSEPQIEVMVRTLDDIVAGRCVAGLKIDVEGAERLVLEGANRLLGERRVRLMQLEWNDCSRSLLGEDREPVARLLANCGYELCRPDANGVLVPVHDIAFGADMFARRTANIR